MVRKSRQWLKEHFSDHYVKKAKQSGYRSRAIFKLLEIQKRDHLFKPGMSIVDLGASPGGWSQYVIECVGKTGKVIAIDLLPMEPIAGVDFVQGDVSDETFLSALCDKLITDRIDWVISDMAPNISGNASVDIPRSLYLAELALNFSLKILNPKGGLLIKVFHGEGFQDLLQQMKHHFNTVVIRKPKASRNRSKEVYILVKDLKKHAGS